MRLSARFAIALFVILLAACQSKGRFSQVWFYTHSSGLVADKDSLLNPVSFLSLRPNGSYTCDFGKFEHGTWSMEDTVLKLTSHDRRTTYLSFKISGVKDLQLRTPNGTMANFESQPLPKGSNDPFSVENNQWRIPPARDESNEELKKRLLNHCRFWEMYFTWALENEFPTIDVRSTPTLIKIYGNGFGLKPYEDLPSAWKSYFYDNEDCRRANEIMTEIFETRSVAWGRTDNKFKMFIGAFQQLQQHLK